MNEENVFKVDIEAEKSSLNSIIESQKGTEDILQTKIEPVSYTAQERAQIEKFAGFSQQIETMRPMSGSLSPISYQSKPIEQESSQKELLFQGSAQADLFRRMNSMGAALNEIAGQVQRKQDLLTNSDAITESRVSIQQRNLMFVDRLARALRRPSWA